MSNDSRFKRPTVRPYLRKGNPIKTDPTRITYPLTIRVSLDGQHDYPLVMGPNGKPVNMTEADFNTMTETLGKQFSEEYQAMIKRQDRVNDIIASVTARGQKFTFPAFRSELQYSGGKKSFNSFYRDYLRDLAADEKGTETSYDDALAALERFAGENIDPFSITEDFLEDAAKFWKKPWVKTWVNKNGVTKTRLMKGAGTTTIGIYMRYIKAVFNHVAKKKIKELNINHPFSDYKIKRGRLGTKGQPLTEVETLTFINIDTEPGTFEEKAHLIFLFSLFAHGMNLRDILTLQYSEIKRGKISYIRDKTETTQDDTIIIEYPLTEVLQDIVVRIGNPNKRPQANVFDLLEPGLTGKELKEAVAQAGKNINTYLAKLCEANGLPHEVTFYWARKTYSQILRDNGVAIADISEILDHSSIKTTEDGYILQRAFEKREQGGKVLEKVLNIKQLKRA